MSQADNKSQSDGSFSPFDRTNWPLIYHTVKNMNARQLSGIVERKIRHTVVPNLPIDFNQKYEQQVPDRLTVSPQPIADNVALLRQSITQLERERYRNRVSEVSNGSVSFLNRSIQFGADIDWDHEQIDDYPLLWRLKLQSFEFFEWAVLGFDDPKAITDLHERFQRWLLSWSTENPIGDEQYLRRSWIPHSVSLRILHWSRYAAWCEQEAIPVEDRLYHQIYKNALFLDNHIEFDIGGNHLIENAVALVVAGVLFETHETGWTETGIQLLEQAGETQFLADGGHFERSPMYHLMVLRRYTTAYSLLSNTDYSVQSLKGTTERALGFLTEITEPAGEIPLLNDSVRDEQISARSCIRYCHSCGLHSEGATLNHPKGSGYRKLTADSSSLLIDVGAVGPPHLPAHSHNDQLSVLLWIEGTPVLTDTGVYNYASTSRRQYSRSVTAHNTAQYADIEPIPVGGSYLMGKRTSTTVCEETADSIRGECARQSVVGPEYEHIREVSATDCGWTISDEVVSDLDDFFTVRYHFTPSAEIEKRTETDNIYNVNHQNSVLATIQLRRAATVELSESPCFERYGQKETQPVVTATASVGSNIQTQIIVQPTDNDETTVT